MKHTFSTLSFIAVLLFFISANAQKIVVQSGDLSFLKGEKNIKLNFIYDGMSVGKFKTEEEYIEHKMKKKGEKWFNNWKGNRGMLYEPKFEVLINKVLESQGISISKKNDSNLILTIRTTRTTIGWYGGIIKMPSYLDFEYIFTEASNPDKVLCKLSQKLVPGSHPIDFDVTAGRRISQSYAKAGKSLGGFLNKNIN